MPHANTGQDFFPLLPSGLLTLLHISLSGLTAIFGAQPWRCQVAEGLRELVQAIRKLSDPLLCRQRQQDEPAVSRWAFAGSPSLCLPI